MYAYDYDAVIFNENVYCVECLPEETDVEDERVLPIFADSEWESYPVCCECGEIHEYVNLI